MHKRSSGLVRVRGMTLFLIPLYLPEQTVVLIGTVKQ